MSNNTTDNLSLEIAYNILLKEFQNPTLQEIPYDIYQKIAGSINNLKINEYEAQEKIIVIKMSEMFSDISSLLLQIRLEKIHELEKTQVFEIDYSKISDEEKYILDGEHQSRKRLHEIFSLINNGQPKVLEKISERIKQKRVLIRFMKPMEQFVGVDMAKYGPFNCEDVANLPLENAISLINNKIASEIFASFD
jgi:DNA replication factor GINS